MKHKMLTIKCQNNLCEALANAITQYAHAAYPPGGSECAQASREALETIAHTIKTADINDASFQIKARQRSTLKAAINWYFGEAQPDADMQQKLLSLFT